MILDSGISLSRRQFIFGIPLVGLTLANQPPASETPGPILYQADFSTWPNDSTAGCGIRFFDPATNEYHLVSTCLGQEFISIVNQPFGDFDYRLTASQPQGNNIAGYGISASFDIGSFYQRFRLFLNRRGELEVAQLFETISDDRLLFEETILKEDLARTVSLNGSNNFRITRVRDRIGIYLNDSLVFSEESTRHRGQAILGFGVKMPGSDADQSGGLTINAGFRNLVVYRPD